MNIGEAGQIGDKEEIVEELDGACHFTFAKYRYEMKRPA